MFSSHPEDVASGFPIDPPRPSQTVEEANNDPQGNIHKRASHSGPLVNRAAWTKAGKSIEDAPRNLGVADLSAMSGLVAARRSMLSEEHRERAYSHHEVPKLIARFPGSFKEASNSMTRQDLKSNGQHEDEKASNNSVPVSKTCTSCNTLLELKYELCSTHLLFDDLQMGKGPRGNKIHYSGPLLVPSGKVDQVLKDHDRQIQEAVRRARVDKERMRRVAVEGKQVSMNTLFVSGR